MPRVNRKKLQDYIERFKRDQGKSTWPGFVESGRNVDEALFKPSRNKPLIQRLGGLLFGIPLILLTVSIVDKLHWSPISIVIVLPGIVLGLVAVRAVIR